MSFYQAIQIAVFVVGALAFFVAVVVPSDPLMVASGVCLALSGLLSLLGIRVALKGPMGSVLRAVLEGRPLLKIHVAAVMWMGLGIYIALWGASRISQPEPDSFTPTHAATAHQ